MGTIKVFGNKKHVAATHIRPIKDHNEVFNHILRAVYVTLSLRNPGGVRSPRSFILHPCPMRQNLPLLAGHGGDLLTIRAQVEQRRRARDTATIPPAQQPRDRILPITHTYLLSNDKSWRSLRRIRVMMGCTSRLSHEQQAVTPGSCEFGLF